MNTAQILVDGTRGVILYRIHVAIYSKVIYNDRLATQMIQVMTMNVNDIVRRVHPFSVLKISLGASKLGHVFERKLYQRRLSAGMCISGSWLGTSKS